MILFEILGHLILWVERDFAPKGQSFALTVCPVELLSTFASELAAGSAMLKAITIAAINNLFIFGNIRSWTNYVNYVKHCSNSSPICFSCFDDSKLLPLKSFAVTDFRRRIMTLTGFVIRLFFKKILASAPYIRIFPDLRHFGELALSVPLCK